MEFVRIILAEHQDIVIGLRGLNQYHVFDRSKSAFSLEVENIAILLRLILWLFRDQLDNISAVVVSNARV